MKVTLDDLVSSSSEIYDRIAMFQEIFPSCLCAFAGMLYRMAFGRSSLQTPSVNFDRAWAAVDRRSPFPDRRLLRSEQYTPDHVEPTSRQAHQLRPDLQPALRQPRSASTGETASGRAGRPFQAGKDIRSRRWLSRRRRWWADVDRVLDRQRSEVRSSVVQARSDMFLRPASSGRR